MDISFLPDMKEIKKAIAILLALCSFTVAFAQQKTVIRGRVIDKKERVAVIGANVIEYDKENRVVNGTICDVNGDFVLELKDPTHNVKIAMIGYNNKLLPAGTSGTINVELEPAHIQLGEVVVSARKSETASLTNIQDRDIATSAVKIDLQDMRESGALSASDALQGKVSGLDILSSSGDPGSGSTITIRGLSSMGNNSPLVVIDGIPQRKVNQIDDQFQIASADEKGISDLLNIALQDIKSITVLKDAASCSVYGAQGADGVLLIETNRGRLGKVKLDYNFKFSIDQQPPAMPMLNGDEYCMLQAEEWHNFNGISSTPDEVSRNKDFADYYNYADNIDWLGELTQLGFTREHYFSISGGGDKTRFYTSLNYTSQDGTTIETANKKFITRVNLDYFLSKKILFQIQFAYTNNVTDGNATVVQADGFTQRSVREMAYIKQPNMSIWEYDGYGNKTGEYFHPITSYQGDGQYYFNPVAVARLGYDQSKANYMQNNFTLSYTINRWFKFRETLSFQLNGSKQKKYLPYSAMGITWLDWRTNKAEEGNSYNTSLHTESQLNFTSPWDSSNHVISGAISWLTTRSYNEWMNLQSNKGPSVDVTDPAIGGQINWIGNDVSEDANVGALLNLNYKYKDRYMIQANLRADAYAAFGANNRWGYFKGLALGWRFSEEPWLKFLNIGESMLHLNWGTSGTPPGSPYSRYALYSTTSNYLYGYNAVLNSQIALDNLKWQQLTEWETGWDINLLDDRLNFNGSLYHKKTTDISFYRYNIPYSTGFDVLTYYNGGEMENKGWEAAVDLKVIKQKDLKLSFNFNISRNKNAFTKLPENYNRENSTSIGNGQYPQRIEEGQPIGSFFGFRYLGVYASDADAVAHDAQGNVTMDNEGNPVPMSYKGTYTFKGGDPIYKDLNHDGLIDLNDVEYLGDSNPDYIGGFGGNLRYKNLSVSCLFHYRLGYQIVNQTALETQGMYDKNNQSKAVLNRWRAQGQHEKNMLPRAVMYHPCSNLGSDRYVEDGDYLRLLNVIVTYNLPTEICQKFNLANMSVTLSTRKLLTFTNYTGQDPEVSMNASNPFWIGKDDAKTPPSRMYTLSVSLTF